IEKSLVGHAVTCAQACPAVTRDVPCHADARRKIFRTVSDEHGVIYAAGRQHSAWRSQGPGRYLRRKVGSRAGEEIEENLIVAAARPVEEIIAQSQDQVDARTDAPTVAEIEREIMRADRPAEVRRGDRRGNEPARNRS